MLQKWKQDKMLRRQQELKTKKPTFKVGIIPPQASQVLSKNDKTNSFKSQDSRVQTTFNGRIPVVRFADSKTRKKNFDLKPPTIVPSNPKSKESKIQAPSKPLAAIPKVSVISTQVKNKIHSGLPKVAESRTLKKPEQMSSVNITRRIPTIPVPKTNQLQQRPLSRLAKATLKAPTKIKPTESQTKKFKSPPKITIPTKNIKAVNQDLNNVPFGCELSHIAPKTPKKSFAPVDFKFCPSSSLHCSLFMEDGPASIFAEIKQETGRTSTPKSSEWKKEANESQKKEPCSDDPHVSNIVFESAVPSECTVSLQSESPTEVLLPEAGMPETEDCTTLLMQEVLEDADKSNSPPERLDVEQQITPTGFYPSSIGGETIVEQHTEVVDLSTIAEEPVVEQLITLDPSKIVLESDVLKIPEVVKVSKMVLGGSDIETVSNANPVKTDTVRTGLSEVISTQNEENIPVFATSRIEGQCEPATRSRLMETRSFRRSERPQLESINESLENTPVTPKSQRKKSALKKDFTPRRSMRLKKLSIEGSPENIMNVRASLHGSPELDNSVSTPVARSSNLTYDFDRLHLESTSQDLPDFTGPTRSGKVSLLYTPAPKGRKSVRKSIKGDLISFSPDGLISFSPVE